MTHISSIGTDNVVNPNSATYNAVKIKINNPKANINDGFKTNPEDNGTYNAVSIEVNNPSISQKKDHHCIYDYKQADCPVCAEQAGFYPVKIPQLPVAYQATNFINNRTFINAEIESDKNLISDLNKSVKSTPEAQLVVVEEFVTVPEPNITTTENQKKPLSEVSFHGINFKAENKNIEIVPPTQIKPEINVQDIIKNLSSVDFDVQAKQMEEIARISMENSQKAIPYIVTEIFSELINIVEKDTTNLTPPSEKQIEIRKQIIINEIVKEQAKKQKQDLTKIELPYKLDEEDMKIASSLSSLEQAERNKEYALYTMAILSKVYTDEILKQTGNVVPLTDLPGVSTIVDTLRYNSNSGVKVAAIDALRYINRPEYNDELSAVLELATADINPYVAQNAAMALDSIN